MFKQLLIIVVCFACQFLMAQNDVVSKPSRLSLSTSSSGTKNNATLSPQVENKKTTTPIEMPPAKNPTNPKPVAETKTTNTKPAPTPATEYKMIANKTEPTPTKIPANPKPTVENNTVATEKPTANSQQPIANNQQPKTTVTPKPTVENKTVATEKPAANSQQLIANSQQPKTTVTPKPTVENKTVATEKPAANSQQLIANSQQPKTTVTPKPTVENKTVALEKPAANSQQPIANNQQPKTTVTPKPTVENKTVAPEKPAANSQQPIANSQQPIANSQQPIANSQQPIANSQQPTPNSQQPKANSQKPTANSQKPVEKPYEMYVSLCEPGWKAGKITEEPTIADYILFKNGQNISNFTEMAGITTYKEFFARNVEQIANEITEEMKPLYGKAKYTEVDKNVYGDNSYIIFMIETKDYNHTGKPQSIIQHVIKGIDYVHTSYYICNTDKMPGDEKRKWTSFYKKATLQSVLPSAYLSMIGVAK